MLDERIEAIRKEYGLDKSDFWELPMKKGTWLVKHAALEVVAAKAGVVFSPPTVLEADSANGLTAILVTGTHGDRSEWSIGEASPKNSKNGYPWAISEKRAKDRVILKLIGIHGLVYSEDEIDPSDRQPAQPQRVHHDEPEEMSNTAAKAHWKTIYDEMAGCTTLKQLKGAWERHYRIFEQLPQGLRDELLVQKDEFKDRLMQAEEDKAKSARPTVAPNFEGLPA